MKPAVPGARLRGAPESFLEAEQIAAVQAGRRDFLRGAFVAAAGLTAAAAGRAEPQGDPAILEPTQYAQGLGQPVAARGYGLPSQYEKNLQRRQSPGLTRLRQSSVSF